ncbi:MAG: YaaR family protein [Papillibacter sp.]|nr:YaaR family protein [Papillibacter sp.]
MDSIKIHRVVNPGYRIASSAGPENRSSSSFQHDLNEQMKHHYKKRISELLDEITKEAEDIFVNVNLPKFERYRSLLKELLSEVLNNAFMLKSELVTDSYGLRRVMTVINVVDEKLGEMASDLLENNRELIDYLGRVDEIRGLIMDLFC